MSASEFQLIAKGYDPSPNADTEAYTDGPTRTRNTIVKRMITGTGTDQVDHVYAEDSGDTGTTTIAASATLSIDLQTALDARGTALALTDSVLVLVTHKAASLSSSISLSANAVNGWTNLLGTAAALTIPPGGVFAFYTPVAASMVIGAANKILDVTNDDGVNAAEYRVEVWGR